MQADRFRRKVAGEMARIFDKADLLLVPALRDEALTITNFTGHPAASIPAGTADGLPVGMQITGRTGADTDVLAASATFERLRPWPLSTDR